MRVAHLRQGPSDGATSILEDKKVLKVVDNVSHHRVSKLCLRGDEQVLGAENRLVLFVDVLYLDVPQSKIRFKYRFVLLHFLIRVFNNLDLRYPLLKVSQLLIQFYLKVLKEIIIGIDFNAQVFDVS